MQKSMRGHKVIQLSFLLLANIILLAHAIVPHHHHEDEGLCFFETRCPMDEEACSGENHDTQTAHHEHNQFPSSDQCCLIDNAYAPAINEIKTSCSQHEKCDCRYTLISNILYTCDTCDEPIIHFRQNPSVPHFYSEFIAQSIGLRAPPAC